MAAHGQRDETDPRPTPHQLAQRLRALQRAERLFGGAAARELGLGTTDLVALADLLAVGPLGPTELGRRLGLGSAAATGLADRLQAAGHVRREAHPSDRRRLALVPTEHARDELLRLVTPLAARVEGIAGELSASERETVARFLDAVLDAYSSHTAGHTPRAPAPGPPTTGPKP